MARQVTIQFTGICDLIAQSDGTILVVLPVATKPVAKGPPPHLAFLRWERKDSDAKTTVTPHPKLSNKEFAVLLLGNDEKLRIGGDFENTSLVVDSSVIDHVPHMDDLVNSKPQTAHGIAARITLGKGYLSAQAVESGHKWVFKRMGDTKIGPSEKPQELYNEVNLDLDVKDSGAPPRIVTKHGDLVIAKGAAGAVIVVGNLEKRDLIPPAKPSYKQDPQDLDFLYHYAVSSQNVPVKDRLVPTRRPKRKRGKRVDCFPAYWGKLKSGARRIRRPRSARS